uniref:Uncharacterized protein n=1 Tax=Romanomermis culicivorax TaxID=13658 RepID=A0A915IFH7_ROMCU
MQETVISFLVNVPVLSEHITLTQPKVSTVGNFLMMARRRAILITPNAKVLEFHKDAAHPSVEAVPVCSVDREHRAGEIVTAVIFGQKGVVLADFEFIVPEYPLPRTGFQMRQAGVLIRT